MDPRRNDKADIKRDQQGVRDAQDEVLEEVPERPVKPRVENPNRDRARGDWDRSGVHYDEDAG